MYSYKKTIDERKEKKTQGICVPVPVPNPIPVPVPVPVPIS
jgi:hypothetical protein